MVLNTQKRLQADIHVHTVASGHAFSTLLELRDYSIVHGIRILGIADHGPSMRGAPHEGYFIMGTDSHRASTDDCCILFGCEVRCTPKVVLI